MWLITSQSYKLGYTCNLSAIGTQTVRKHSNIFKQLNSSVAHQLTNLSAIFWILSLISDPIVFPSGGTTPEVGSPENFKKGYSYKPPEGSPEGVPFSEASSRARLRRANWEAPPAERSRGRPAERSEAPPNKARLHRGSAERSEAAQRSSGGRHYKKTA